MCEENGSSRTAFASPITIQNRAVGFESDGSAGHSTLEQPEPAIHSGLALGNTDSSPQTVLRKLGHRRCSYRPRGQSSLNPPVIRTQCGCNTLSCLKGQKS